MKPCDANLLETFVRNRDEETFRMLADKHLGLVFHTALRRTGNRIMAEEISQNVLIALARKAGTLAARPEMLPAWLHRATVYESLKAMRKESTRQRLMKLQHPDDVPALAPEESKWSEALPHLDLALNRLSQSDREVLVLHFYESLPFPRIAKLLGRSSAAVQKQSVRALEKLSRMLRAKGVIVSATALVAGLGSELAKGAPMGMAKTMSATALAANGAPSFGGIFLFMTTHSKIMVPCVVLLGVIPLAFQQAAISRLKEEQRSSLQAGREKENPPPRSSRRSGSVIAQSPERKLQALIAEFKKARVGTPAEWASFRQRLRGMEPSELEDFIRRMGEVILEIDPKSELLGMFVAALGDTDPELALTVMMETIKGQFSFGHLLLNPYIETPFRVWAEKDSRAALEWMRKQEEGLNHDQMSDFNIAYPPMLARALVEKDPGILVNWLDDYSEEERTKILSAAIYRDPSPANIGPLMGLLYRTSSREQRFMIVGLIHSDSLSDISAAMENAGVEIQDENALEYFKLYRFHEGIREQGAFELFQKWLTGHAPESEAEFQEISRIYQENTSRQ